MPRKKFREDISQYMEYVSKLAGKADGNKYRSATLRTVLQINFSLQITEPGADGSQSGFSFEVHRFSYAGMAWERSSEILERSRRRSEQIR